jgi:hypothetical protein
LENIYNRNFTNKETSDKSCLATANRGMHGKESENAGEDENTLLLPEERDTQENLRTHLK